jgi:hypothetical protein
MARSLFHESLPSVKGVKNSTCPVGNSKSAGMTPTMVIRRLPPCTESNLTVFPMASGADWKTRRHASIDSTTTSGFASSLSTSVRPSMARAPSIVNAEPDVIPPHIRTVP